MSKKCKTALTFFISVVLIISLNLNTFAAPISVNFFNCDFTYDFYKDNKLSDLDFEYNRTYVKVGNSSSSFLGGRNYTEIYPKSGYNASLLYGYDVLFSFAPEFNLICNNQYTLDFYINVNSTAYSSYCKLTVFLLISGDNYSNSIDICDGLYLDNNGLSVNKYISSDLVIPSITNGSYCLMFLLRSYEEGGVPHSSFCVSDICFTSPNPVDEAFENVIYPATSEQIDDLNNQYEDVMNDLPNVSTDDVEGVLDYDFSEFNNGLNFVRELFERTMNTFNFNLVLAFALSIGFVTYVLGRKVG